VVLVAPEVHWNTGNVGRTCLGANASLHLVRPLGFSLASRQVKRAGLDYWPRVDLSVWDSFDHFLAGMAPAPEGLRELVTEEGARAKTPGAWYGSETLADDARTEGVGFRCVQVLPRPE
jgi:tRNA (cytidine/uridine-2'-O-)-methyltransferase